MIRIFMLLSGNLGDTLNVMPVLSGIYKSTGHKISLVVRDTMKSRFVGFKEFMEMQDCIFELKYESELSSELPFIPLTSASRLDEHPNRPWETVRLDIGLRSYCSIEYEVDDDFTFNVPDISCPTDKILVGDRIIHSDQDHRRPVSVLKNSGKFLENGFYYLDYSLPLTINVGYIKSSPHPFITTFTGISVISNLMFKKTIVLYDDIFEKTWNIDEMRQMNVSSHIQPLIYSFNKHFYRNRNTFLAYINDIKVE